MTLPALLMPPVAPILRRADWAVRLQACVVQRLAQPFAWAAQDCCTFAADCIAATTDVDPMADLRGAYTCAITAARLIARHGGLRTLVDERLASQGLGQRIALSRVLAGDVGLTHGGLAGEPVLAVWCGTAWLAPARTGLQGTPVPVCAWGVGHG